MQVTELVLTDAERQLLASVRGSRWENLSGPMFDTDDFAWESVRLETTSSAITIELCREVVEIASDIDEYPALHVSPAGDLSPAAKAEGAIVYHGRNETVQRIWVIRDTVEGTKAGEPDFVYVADIGIVFELETLWMAITRTSRLSPAFHIRRAPTKDGLILPDTWAEWDSDLLNQYAVTREWIPIDVST